MQIPELFVCKQKIQQRFEALTRFRLPELITSLDRQFQVNTIAQITRNYISFVILLS